MTRAEKIAELQDQITHNMIDKIELDHACVEYKLDLWEDVLSPIEYNLCDRCGDYGDSELDFFWVDGFDWQDDNPKDYAILRAVAREGIGYACLCWDCVEELKKKGV